MREPHDSFLKDRLKQASQLHGLRSLKDFSHLIDFTSNDTLGFSRSPDLRAEIASEWAKGNYPLGSTGSRLLSGHSALVQSIEEEIARFHGAESTLLFNSGFDANVGLLSSIARTGDTIFYDELIHASSRDGIKLSPGQSFPFRHGDLKHLEARLNRTTGRRFVAVESLYSMDGDYAALEAISALCEKYGAHLIVDEAHSTGIRGNGCGYVQELGLEEKIFARIHTFGKALGQHGAAVVGPKELKEYLVNFSRPLIYSTALPPHSLIAIRTAYRKLGRAHEERKTLNQLIATFNSLTETQIPGFFLPSFSPIQCCMIPGVLRTRMVAERVQKEGFDVRPIVFPTVAQGKERIRITLHCFNSEAEVHDLVTALKNALEETS